MPGRVSQRESEGQNTPVLLGFETAISEGFIDTPRALPGCNSQMSHRRDNCRDATPLHARIQRPQPAAVCHPLLIREMLFLVRLRPANGAQISQSLSGRIREIVVSA